MADRDLTVIPLTDDEIGSVTVEDAFGELLDELGVESHVLRTDIVRSAKAGEADHGYLVQLHEVPSHDGETQRVRACTCAGFKFHQLREAADAIKADPASGLAALGVCKHGEEVEIVDRSTDTREGGQGGLGAFGAGGES